MAILILAIAGIWAVLLGVAYLSRVSAGLSKSLSTVVVTVSYVAVSALVLVWLGFNTTGFIAVAGTLLPFAVAIRTALTAIPLGT